MSRHVPPTDDERADSLIETYKEQYAEDKITLDELEADVADTLQRAQDHWRPIPIPPPTFVCPWCSETVTQDRHNFNWWCTACGKNATDHPGWDGAA